MQYSTSSENYSTSYKDSPSKWSGSGKQDGKGGYMLKKASYQYSSNNNNQMSYSDKSASENIDQLDALLEDLKNERQFTRDKDLLSSPVTTYKTIERERNEPAGTITKTTKIIKTSKQLGGENQTFDDVEKFSTSDYSTLRSNGGFSTLRDVPKNEEYRTREITTYETSKAVPSNVYGSKNEIYRSSNRIVENSELLPVQTSSGVSPTPAELEKDLQNIALTDNILPVPGTKVTTTVRTYTYEIPANAPSTLSRNALQRNVNYSTIDRSELSNVNLQPKPHPVPQTVVYNTESYSTLDRTNERPVVTNKTYEIREHHESNTIHQNNITPQPVRHHLHPTEPTPGSNSKTIVYNINKTENIHNLNEPHRYPHSPSQSPQGPPHTSYSPGSPPISGGNYPPGPTTSRYFYKESSNTVNTIHGPPNGEPPIIGIEKPVPSSGYPPHGDGSPYPPHSTTIYKYSSSTNTTNNTRRGPDYGTPNGHVSPFPVDGLDIPIGNGNPPQRVDDLMQSFGNSDAVDRSDIENPHRKREIETAVASPNQPHIPSVNKAGREVYYPPGHETMMMKREEMAAGSAAGGRWAKGSGMYEYESGYKSKSKTKSGGAMVPVCLPLCCAMPCSIM